MDICSFPCIKWYLINPTLQKQAASTVKQMAGSLSQFAAESNKEDVTSAASDIVGSLGSVAKVCEVVCFWEDLLFIDSCTLFVLLENFNFIKRVQIEINKRFKTCLISRQCLTSPIFLPAPI